MATRPGYKHPSQKAGPYIPTRGKFAGQTFGSYRAYQNANAQSKGFTSAATRLAAPRKPKAATLASKKAFDLSAAGRAANAYLLFRRGDAPTIAQAAKAAHTTMSAVRRYVGKALTREGSRIVVAKTDAVAVPMAVNSTEGAREGFVRGSRARELVGLHSSVLAIALSQPTPIHIRALAKFKGRTIRFTDGRCVELLWDIDAAKRLARRGLLTHAGPYEVAGMLGEAEDRSAA